MPTVCNAFYFSNGRQRLTCGIPTQEHMEERCGKRQSSCILYTHHELKGFSCNKLADILLSDLFEKAAALDKHDSPPNEAGQPVYQSFAKGGGPTMRILFSTLHQASLDLLGIRQRKLQPATLAHALGLGHRQMNDRPAPMILKS